MVNHHGISSYWVEADLERLQKISKKKTVKTIDRLSNLTLENETLKEADKKLRFQILKVVSENRGHLIEIERLKKVNSLLLGKLSGDDKGLIT